MVQQMLVIWSLIPLPWASLMTQMVNKPSAGQESWVDPWEESHADSLEPE